MSRQKDELENLLEGKFLTASKFSLEIEEIVRDCKGELNYIEASFATAKKTRSSWSLSTN